MTIQSNNNNLNYLIDPTFTKVNRLFALPFERINENVVKKRLQILQIYLPIKKSRRSIRENYSVE